MDLSAGAELLALQSDVISRAQLRELGGTDADLARMVRRRELTRLLPGVYVGHTGTPTWLQRCWAGVLFCGSAALDLESALRAALGPGWRRHDDSRADIVVAVEHGRKVAPQRGYRFVTRRHLAEESLWNTSPPRVRLETAAVEVASACARELEAIALLADTCQSRRTTAERMLTCLDGRSRTRSREFLRGVLTDISQGTCSVLEHGYLTRVERAHGLPKGRRQDRALAGPRPVYRDTRYLGHGLVVELDGRLFHDTATQRDRDLDRDLDAFVHGQDTVRLGWGQVFDRPCRTTQRLSRILRDRGWSGEPCRCGPDCLISTSTA